MPISGLYTRYLLYNNMYDLAFAELHRQFGICRQVFIPILAVFELTAGVLAICLFASP